MSKAHEQSGVNIHAGYEAVKRMSSHVKRTMHEEVIGSLGGFGTTFDLPRLNMTAPVLVFGTDGIGTKLKPVIDYGKHDSIGIDAVAMCVNDILMTGAEPLYFLDYIATNKVIPGIVEQVIKGASDVCAETSTVLIGRETAEMGEMYHEGECDVAGFAVGTAGKDDYVDGSEMKEEQVVIGLASSGIHSNGCSLVRKSINESDIDLASDFDNRPFIDVSLEPTKLYAKLVLALKREVSIKAVNHITGGGFYENIPHASPAGCATRIDTTLFPTPKIFDWLQQQGNIDTNEMYNIFSMGVGYTIIVDKKDVSCALKILAEQDVEAYQIGHIVKGESIAIELLGV